MDSSPTIDFGLSLDWTVRDFKTHFTPEKLLRLHPHWHVGEIISDDDAWQADLKNHETEAEFQLTFRVRFGDGATGDAQLRIEFEAAPLTAMVVTICDGKVVARLEDYQPADEEDPYQFELWLRGIYGYLSLYEKNTLWRRINRIIMNRYLIPMNPSQRKISIMIYRFTVLEVVVILIIAAGYFMFMR